MQRAGFAPATLIALLVATALFAGCTGDATTETSGGPTTGAGSQDGGGAGGNGGLGGTGGTGGGATTTPQATQGTMIVAGLVTDESFVPVADANVTMPALGKTVVTNAQGLFSVPDVPRGAWLIEARHAGFVNGTQFVNPTENDTVVADFILAALPTDQPYQAATVRYDGFLECGFDALIFAGPCDLLLKIAGQGVFTNASSFTFPVDDRWATVVLDMDFEPADQPLLDGMRMTVRGLGASNELGTYEQYGRFHDAAPFGIHITPGMTYEDGTAGAVPANLTAFQVEVYPHALGYHAVCTPGIPMCFLGAGAGLNVQFQLYVTVFYVGAAPAGFTTLS